MMKPTLHPSHLSRIQTSEIMILPVLLLSMIPALLETPFVAFENDTKTIHLNIDLILNNDVLIGDSITDVSAGSEGEIIVALYDLSQVRVFDREGNSLHNFGQRGRGPGDFQNIRTVSLLSGLIYALDGGANAKINIFNPADPDAIDTIGLPPLRTETGINVVNGILFIDDENILISYLPATSNDNIDMELTSSYYLVNSNSTDVKTLVFKSSANERYVTRTESGFINSAMPFGRTNHIAKLNDEIFHMWTGDDKIQVYNTNDWSNTRYFSVEELADQIELTEEDYRQYYRDRLNIDLENEMDNLAQLAAQNPGLRTSLISIQSMAQNFDKLHTTFPVYNQLLSCDNYLWITAPHYDRSIQHLKQLDADGNVLASGTLPVSVEVKDIKDGYLYGIDKDEDGFRTVVRYELEIR